MNDKPLNTSVETLIIQARLRAIESLLLNSNEQKLNYINSLYKPLHLAVSNLSEEIQTEFERRFEIFRKDLLEQ